MTRLERSRLPVFFLTSCVKYVEQTRLTVDDDLFSVRVLDCRIVLVNEAIQKRNFLVFFLIFEKFFKFYYCLLVLNELYSQRRFAHTTSLKQKNQLVIIRLGQKTTTSNGSLYIPPTTTSLYSVIIIDQKTILHRLDSFFLFVCLIIF